MPSTDHTARQLIIEVISIASDWKQIKRKYRSMYNPKTDKINYLNLEVSDVSLIFIGKSTNFM